MASPINHISDTARFVAYLRGQESLRPDALYHDPLAVKLAGPNAPAIMKHFRSGRRFGTQTMAVRTKVIDELLLHQVNHSQVDTVLNLAAGLDTRPYRLNIPAGLKWIEVDFPEITAEKAAILKEETPRCCLERVPLDLRIQSERMALFSRVNQESSRVLVLTEGLLMYLLPEHVNELSQEFLSLSHFSYWLCDLMSPRSLNWLKKNHGKDFSAANADLHFAPKGGPRYFTDRSWIGVDQRFMPLEQKRLRRETLTLKLIERLSHLWPAFRKQYLRSYSILLLSRA